MKICFFRHSLLSRGGDKMVVEYADYLTSQRYDVVIQSNVVNSIFKIQTRIEKISNNTSKISTIINAALKKRSFDIIIADIIIMIFFLSFRNRKKLLFFAQDYDESYYRSFFMKLVIRVVYFYCLRVLKIPVIAVSDELGCLLRKRFNANVTVVPNGVNTDVFYPDRDEALLSLKGDSKVILVFARSDFRKGFDIAVKVISKFKNDIDSGDISIWAVGEDIDVPFRMRNFGFVPPEKLRKILSCSDVLLYPSRHEGLPLFVLEAMACGCPVVTTEAVKITTHGFSSLKCRIGYVDECVELTKKILYDNFLREQLALNGLKEAEKYSLTYSKERFEKQLNVTRQQVPSE